MISLDFSLTCVRGKNNQNTNPPVFLKAQLMTLFEGAGNASEIPGSVLIPAFMIRRRRTPVCSICVYVHKARRGQISRQRKESDGRPTA